MNELIPGYATTNFSDNPNQCPACGALHRAATSVRPGQYSPIPGSASLCFDCGALAIYDENLRLRPMRVEELEDWKRSAAWPAIEAVQAKIRARRAELDAQSDLAKRIQAEVEKQWGWIRGPRPANAVILKRKKPRRHK